MSCGRNEPLELGAARAQAAPRAAQQTARCREHAAAGSRPQGGQSAGQMTLFSQEMSGLSTKVVEGLLQKKRLKRHNQMQYVDLMDPDANKPMMKTHLKPRLGWLSG